VKVLNRLALDAVDRQELERARETLGRALTLLPEEAMSLRNLAVVLLMQRKEAEALDALARLSRQNARPDLSLARLRARASLGVGKRDEARAELEQALPLAQKLKGVEFAAFSAELGALLSDAGQHDQAVALLEQGFKESGVNPVADSLRHNLAEALVARARQRAVEGKQLEGAADDLKRALGPLDPGLAPRQTAPATCLLGTVELQLGRFSDAVETFRRAQVGGGCSMAPPYDRLGAPFFQAYAAYRESGNLKGRDESVRQLVTLLAKSSGATQELLRRLVRSAYEQLGYDYFLKSDERRAESSLRAAQRVPGSGEHRELDHNVAVLDLLAGRTAQAEKVLDGLAGRPLESWVNLGIVRERQGEVREALQLYRRAFDKGLKLPKLRDWIEVKERLFGGAP
jgi:tetratricopeptide (TPR) repeat protein